LRSIGGAKEVQLEEPCGVIGKVDPDSGNVEPYGMEITNADCGASLLINCTVDYAVKCPSSCPFVVEDPAVSCFFKCVAAETCSKNNPDFPWPDEATHQCSPCNVSLCKRCSRNSQCEECHENFRLTPDGQCVLWLNLGWLDILVKVVKLLVIAVVILGIIWKCVKGRHGRADKHLVASRRARLHRHLCKTAKWQLDDGKQPRKWWSLGDNMHTENVVGVGLAMWYNSLCFMMLVAIVTFVVTFYIHHWGVVEHLILQEADSSHQVIEFIEKHQGGKVIFEDDSRPIHGHRPALLVSPLMHCGHKDPHQGREDLMDMATRTFWAMQVLYGLLVAISLWFGRFQKAQALEFDSNHPTMADYALQVKGLPKDMTDEASLAAELQGIIRTHLPEEVKRPAQLRSAKDRRERDEMVDVKDSPIEVFGVSLCYDFTERRGEVDDAIWKLIEVQEVELYNDAKKHKQNDRYLANIYEGQELEISDTSLYKPADSSTHNLTTEEAHARIRQKVEPLFSGGDKLQTNGQAYVIFNYISDLERFWEFYTDPKNKDKIKWKNGEKLEFLPVFTEPPCVAWWSAGLTETDIAKRCFRALLIVILLIGFLVCCLNFPYYYFIQRPYRDVGAVATGTVTGIYGLIISNVNGLIFWGIYMVGEGIGFHRKDALFRFVCVTTIVFILILTTGSVAVTAKMLVEKYHHTDPGSLFKVNMKYLGVEIGFSEAIYNMMPGVFFGNALMKVVMPQLQYCWVIFLQKLIYVWRCLPDPLLRFLQAILPYKPETLEHLPFRNAEKAVDPWEIPVMGDYADWVTVPFLCFTTLMFMSSFVWKLFGLMFCWVVFQYFYFRYTHLRYHRINFYSTNRLQVVAMYSWGLALSVVAIQIPLWGFRADYFGEDWPVEAKFALLIVTFASSCALWAVLYWLTAQPWISSRPKEENTEQTFNQTEMRCVYSWLNTNPVYVLKCKYYYYDERGQEIAGDNKNKDGNMTRRGTHPIASGEDDEEVRFFEVGKEYLFIRPERQHLLGHNMADFMEPEYWIDRTVWRLGQMETMFEGSPNSLGNKADPSAEEPLLYESVQAGFESEQVN
jgi:hypothetical protein